MMVLTHTHASTQRSNLCPNNGHNVESKSEGHLEDLHILGIGQRIPLHGRIPWAPVHILPCSCDSLVDFIKSSTHGKVSLG